MSLNHKGQKTMFHIYCMTEKNELYHKKTYLILPYTNIKDAIQTAPEQSLINILVVCSSMSEIKHFGSADSFGFFWSQYLKKVYFVFRQYRLMAYRQFINWVRRGQPLGKKFRVVIPACVVLKIRKTFPEASGIYEGFHSASSSESELD